MHAKVAVGSAASDPAAEVHAGCMGLGGAHGCADGRPAVRQLRGNVQHGAAAGRLLLPAASRKIPGPPRLPARAAREAADPGAAVFPPDLNPEP